MRRPVHDGQNPRRLHENPTTNACRPIPSAGSFAVLLEPQRHVAGPGSG
jgi:hypothetical protein